MALHDHFQGAIGRAHQAARGGSAGGSADISLQLHQVIIGPRGTGKSTAAAKYAESLLDEKLVLPGKAVTLDCGGAPALDDFETALRNARGGVLILDNAHHLSRQFHGYDPIALLKKSMVDRALVVVFVGETAGVEEMTREEPGLKRLLNAPVHLTHRFSDAEISEYHAAEAETRRRAALSDAEREAEDQKHRSAAQWREKREVEVSSGNAVRPMRVIRFTRKDAGA